MKKPNYRAMRAKLRAFLRINKTLSNVIIGALGVALILTSCFFLSSGSPGYDALMGLGTGLITDVVIVVLLWAMVPDFSEQEANLSEWGLVEVLPERREVDAVSRKHMPRHELDIAAYGLRHLREDIDTAKLVKRIQRGLVVRAMVPRPYSSDVVARQRLEENADLSIDLSDLIRWLQEIERKANANVRCRGQVSYQVYEGAQLDYYLRCDDDVFVGPYIPKESSGSSVTYKYRLDSPGGKYYAILFEDIWAGNRGISIVSGNKADVYYGFDQVAAIKSVLKYFAKDLRHGADTEVIGVVSIFKENLRRTFCSCNKRRGEKHHVHVKEEGVVGEVLRRRESMNANVALLCDYINRVTFVYIMNSRNEIMRVESGVPASMTASDDMTLLMAAPLVVTSDSQEKVVGALTYDYANFPSEYLSGYQDMIRLSERNEGTRSFNIKEILERRIEESDTALETLRDIALIMKSFEEATNIISKMIGTYAVVSYDDFLRENWDYTE